MKATVLVESSCFLSVLSGLSMLCDYLQTRVRYVCHFLLLFLTYVLSFYLFKFSFYINNNNKSEMKFMENWYLYGYANIIIQHLSYSKICSNWVSRYLTDSYMEQRRTICTELLNINDGDSLSNTVIGDETWIYHFKLETKWQFMERHHTNSPWKEILNKNPQLLGFWRSGSDWIKKLEKNQRDNFCIFVPIMISTTSSFNMTTEGHTQTCKSVKQLQNLGRLFLFIHPTSQMLHHLTFICSVP